MSWQGKQMPEYPRTTARGVRPLRVKSERAPRTAEIVDLDATAWKSAIVSVLISGCGLLLSPTSDGGALSVTLYFGDERGKDYAASSEELLAVLNAATDQAMAYDLGRTPIAGKKGPSRS